MNGRVYDLGSRWWDFLPGKSLMVGDVLQMVNDLGDGHAIMTVPHRLATAPIPDPTIPIPDFPVGQGTIAMSVTAPDSPTVTIEGRDEREMPIKITMVGNSFHANPFARISRIYTQRTVNPVTLTYTAPNDDIYGGLTNTLAIIEPSEEETYYRRYFIPTLAQQATIAIEAFCKRRHIEFTADTDVLPFANVTALGLGLDAYALEAEGDKTGANQFWQDGVGVLNSELGDANAENQVPAIRFHYPGRTQPKLRTHF